AVAVDLAEPLAALQRLADLDGEGGELARDRRAQVQRIETLARDFEALVERGGGGAQISELARLQPFVARLLGAHDLGAAPVRLIGVAAVGDGPPGDEAALG